MVVGGGGFSSMFGTRKSEGSVESLQEFTGTQEGLSDDYRIKYK